MKDIQARLAALGISIPEIFLPNPYINLEKWAVIACDQFTQDAGYWEKVRNKTEKSPTTLDLIFPEIHLKNSDENARANKRNSIHSAMKSLLEKGDLITRGPGGIYIERSTPHHETRRGIVLAVDLEKYEWLPSKKPLVRATEGTVADRLPLRMEIRRNAALETTHVLLLIDDEKDELIPALGRIANASPLYSTPLMMNSGSVSGWALDTQEACNLLACGLEDLAKKANERYGVNEEVPFLYAAGDGNHSLAAAKGVWEEYKAAHAGEAGLESHPARYALVELENLHDPGISFEPIHRIIFGVSPGELCEFIEQRSELKIEKTKKNGLANIFCITSDSKDIITVSLEPLLEKFLEQKGENVYIDYIHGEDELIRLAAARPRDAAGLLLPPVNKYGFFRTIAQNGPLPRKSFSMGESCEKRFYLECRRLFG